MTEKEREYKRRWFQEIKADPEKYEAWKEKARKWYWENRETILARKSKRYRNDEEFREKTLEYGRKYKAFLRGECDG